MAAGFGIRTGRHHITRCEKWTRQSARLFHPSAQSGDAFSLEGASRGVLASVVVAVVDPLSSTLPREPVAIACSGRWAIALILKPVPNVSADIGRLIAF